MTVKVYVPAVRSVNDVLYPFCAPFSLVELITSPELYSSDPLVNLKVYGFPHPFGFIIFPDQGSVHPPLAVNVNFPSESPLHKRDVFDSSRTKLLSISSGFFTDTEISSSHPLPSSNAKV